MGLYDCMYLVPKEQYDTRTRGTVDGVGGDVRESQINNFEVSHGGTVVIREDGGKQLRPVADIEKQEEEEEEKKRMKKRKRKRVQKVQTEGEESHDDNGSVDGGGNRVFPIMKLGGADYAGNSAKLRAAGKQPNAVAADFGRHEAVGPRTDPRRREAILTAARQSNERVEQFASQQRDDDDGDEEMTSVTPSTTGPLPSKRKKMSLSAGLPTPSVARAQKEALDAFVQLRMKQLQGKLPKRAKVKDLDRARRIVHELRDVHKNAVKASAAKKLLPHPTPSPDVDDVWDVVRPPPPPSPRRVTKKVRFAVAEPEKVSYDDDDEEEEDGEEEPARGRIGKRTHVCDPWEEAKKKSRTAGTKTGRHWPDMQGWTPLSKKHRRMAEKAARRSRDDDEPTAVKRRRVGGYAHKRAREDEGVFDTPAPKRRLAVARSHKRAREEEGLFDTPAPKRRLAVAREASKGLHPWEEEEGEAPAAKRRPPKEAERVRKRLRDEVLALPSLSKKHRLQASKRRLEEELFDSQPKVSRRRGNAKRPREGDEPHSTPAAKRRLAEAATAASKRPHDADEFDDPYLLPKKITKKNMDELERRVLEEDEENWRDLLTDALYSDNAQ